MSADNNSRTDSTADTEGESFLGFGGAMTAIGAAVGSVVPFVGTMIGGAIGTLASYAFGSPLIRINCMGSRYSTSLSIPIEFSVIFMCEETSLYLGKINSLGSKE